MKSKLLTALSALLIIGFSGFSGRNHPTANVSVAGKNFNSPAHFTGDAWIASNYDFLACPNQHYAVRDAAPGDTFHWYVTWEDWTLGTTDFGTDAEINFDFSPGDEITLVVNEGTPNEYFYYNTLSPCGD